MLNGFMLDEVSGSETVVAAVGLPTKCWCHPGSLQVVEQSIGHINREMKAVNVIMTGTELTDWDTNIQTPHPLQLNSSLDAAMLIATAEQPALYFPIHRLSLTLYATILGELKNN